MQESKLEKKWKGLTQKEWRRELQALLLSSDKALECAIIRIWEQQTYMEQESGKALIADGVGFNRYDAPILCHYAQQINSTGSLTPYQRTKARKIMPKYWKQLMRISKVQHGW